MSIKIQTPKCLFICAMPFTIRFHSTKMCSVHMRYQRRLLRVTPGANVTLELLLLLTLIPDVSVQVVFVRVAFITLLTVVAQGFDFTYKKKRTYLDCKQPFHVS